ncbi:MAG: amidohydrolase family protein [Candidatus Aminicenantia bacterium]
MSSKGLIVSPGFIDMHSHVDEGMYFPENRACLNYLKQGVTTAVVGQCGSSAWPIFEKPENQIEMWKKEGIGINLTLLIGHGTVREIVMGRENRKPTEEELEKMKALVRVGMEAGAFGISAGLIYVPSSYADTSEIIELMKVVSSYGGIYHSHIRNERENLLSAILEAIEISEKTGAPAHISHFKVLGRDKWGLSEKACELIEKARERGVSR